MDYRYFPDPDLLPLVITDGKIASIQKVMPELPAAMAARMEGEFGLSTYDARLLTQTRAIATYFDEMVATAPDQAKLCANWINGELASHLNRDNLEVEISPISPLQLATLVLRIADGRLSSKMAKQVFGYMWAGERGGDADAIIEARRLEQVTDSGTIEKIIDDVLTKNEKSVAEFKSGKDKAIQALIGQVMKASQGKANPGQVNDLLRKKLAE